MRIATFGRSWQRGGGALAVVLGMWLGMWLPVSATADPVADVQPAASYRKQQAAAQARVAAVDREIAETESALAELAASLTSATAAGDEAAAALTAALDAEPVEPPAEPDVQEPKGAKADPLPALRDEVGKAQERIAALSAKQAKQEQALTRLRAERATEQTAVERLGWQAEFVEGAVLARIAEQEGAQHQAQVTALATQAEELRQLAYARTVALAELRQQDGDPNEIAATASEVRSLEKQAREAAHQLDAHKYGVIVSAKRYERGTAQAEDARAKLIAAGLAPNEAGVGKGVASYKRLVERRAKGGGGFWYRYLGRPLEVACKPFVKLAEWVSSDESATAPAAAVPAATVVPMPTPDPVAPSAAVPAAPVAAPSVAAPAAPMAPVRVDECPVCRQIGHRADQHVSRP